MDERVIQVRRGRRVVRLGAARRSPAASWSVSAIYLAAGATSLRRHLLRRLLKGCAVRLLRLRHGVLGLGCGAARQCGWVAWDGAGARVSSIGRQQRLNASLEAPRLPPPAVSISSAPAPAAALLPPPSAPESAAYRIFSTMRTAWISCEADSVGARAGMSERCTDRTAACLNGSACSAVPPRRRRPGAWRLPLAAAHLQLGRLAQHLDVSQLLKVKVALALRGLHLELQLRHLWRGAASVFLFHVLVRRGAATGAGVPGVGACKSLLCGHALLAWAHSAAHEQASASCITPSLARLLPQRIRLLLRRLQLL